MRTPPRAKKCQEIIDTLESYLEYYMDNSDAFKSLKRTDIQHLRDYINEISVEKKVTEIKLAAKIKKEAEGRDD